VAGAERAQRRPDRLQVAQRGADQHERAQQHRPLSAQVGAEQRPDLRRAREQALVERVHQLLATRGEQVEAGLQGVDVQVHGASISGRGARREGARRWKRGGHPTESGGHVDFRGARSTPV
jgi:nucleotidyltransferase/DNA polymerase involved in DNA repair